MMARTYAQAAALVFLIVGLGGLLTGDAGHVVHGRASGNIDGVALHLTYVRDVINIAIGLGFVYAGWRAGERDAAITVLAAGAVLLLLAVAGFIANDDDAGTRSFATLHFPQCTYPSGWWSATMACKAGGPDQFREAAAKAKRFDTRYYHAGIHRAALTLPEFLRP